RGERPRGGGGGDAGAAAPGHRPPGGRRVLRQRRGLPGGPARSLGGGAVRRARRAPRDAPRERLSRRVHPRGGGGAPGGSRARGFRKVVDVWGPDHHGYIARLKAAMAALGLESDFLDILLVQQVNLLSHGQPVKMSKRADEFITQRDLMEEVGSDAARFFFL